MKKIGLIAHYGEDYISYRVNFLEFLSKKGYNTFACVPKDEHWKEVKASPYLVYPYSYRRSWKAIISIPKAIYSIARILRKENPQFLFTIKFFPNIIGILAGKYAKVPEIAATIAGLGFLDNKDRSLMIKWIFKFYMNILDKADYVIIQNSDDLNYLSTYLKKPKLILTNGSGVNASRFITRSKLKETNSKKTYLFCSRIVREKGLVELILAFNELCIKPDFNATLKIAGWFDEPNLEHEVRSLASSNPSIEFVGYHKNVVPLMQEADCVVLPSYYPEGVPRSLTESLAMSKPIITTDHKGCREACIDKVNGFLVEPKSKESLRAALSNFNKLSEVQIESMQKASRDLFMEKFEEGVIFKTISTEMNL